MSCLCRAACCITGWLFTRCRDQHSSQFRCAAVCRIVYEGSESVNADGSSAADVRAWELKCNADASVQAQAAGSCTDDEDAALEQALDAFQAGELSDDEQFNESGSERSH